MFENVLTLNNVSYGKKITYKTLVSATIIALAIVLPQIFHLALGQAGGIKFLPMYLPVLIGGCLMGAKWGAAIGMLSPLVSFIITSAISEPMPMLQRLPFMIIELTVFAFVSGLFSKKISENGIWAFPAVILSQFVGRGIFIGAVAVFNSFVPFTPAIIWRQIQTGFIGLAIQAVIVPIIIIIMKKLMIKDKNND